MNRNCKFSHNHQQNSINMSRSLLIYVCVALFTTKLKFSRMIFYTEPTILSPLIGHFPGSKVSGLLSLTARRTLLGDGKYRYWKCFPGGNQERLRDSRVIQGKSRNLSVWLWLFLKWEKYYTKYVVQQKLEKKNYNASFKWSINSFLGLFHFRLFRVHLKT